MLLLILRSRQSVRTIAQALRRGCAFSWLIASLTATLTFIGANAPAETPAEERLAGQGRRLVEQFQTQVRPLLETYCLDCHSVDYSEGGVELDRLDPDVVTGDDAERWLEAMDMINGGEMPPEDADQPTSQERQQIVDWSLEALQLAREAHREETPTLRRMTKQQYRNTLCDLLKVAINFGEALPDEAKSEQGFTNNAATLQTSSLHLEMFESIAREALGKAIVEGDKPPSLRYRVTLGAGLEGGGKAGMFGGYQCIPIDRENIRVELFREEATPLADDTPLWNKTVADIKREIGVGMRGEMRRRRNQVAVEDEDQESNFVHRFRVVDAGMKLFSAYPRKEVPPASWQGPSPNLKMLLRRVVPTNGPFAVRIRVSNPGQASETPYAQVFVGSRTDDGLEYKELGEPIRVVGKQTVTLAYAGRFENFPAPNLKNPGHAEGAHAEGAQSGILVVGLWNDHMVKDPAQNGSELLVHSIELESPYYPVWPPESHRAIFFEDALREHDVQQYTRHVIERFLSRAFRRNTQPEEVDRYFQFWTEIRKRFDSYEQGVREVLVAVLCSPEFLYIDRPGATGDIQLATKLSYFLWNSPPDQELIDSAASGELRAELDDTVREMLAKPAARRFIEQFASEWLRLDRHASMKLAVKKHPEYTRYVQSDMREETIQYLQHAFANNLSARALIASDFVFVNQNLAEYYGIEGVQGAEFRKTTVDAPSQRGGLLTQGSFLVGHSDGVEPHPIKRAIWLKEHLLDEPPPPPPPNVPEIDPETPGFQKLTLKEQLQLHRDKDSCRDCHKKIDPYGIVFEQFDASGRLRETAKGRPVDDQSTMPDGTALKGVGEMQQYLLDKRYEDFLRSLCTHLFAYANGQDVTYAETPQIDRLVEAAQRDDRLISIITEVVKSEAFLGPAPSTIGFVR